MLGSMQKFYQLIHSEKYRIMSQSGIAAQITNPYSNSTVLTMPNNTTGASTEEVIASREWVNGKIFDVLDWNSLLNIGAPSSQTNYETYNSRNLTSYSTLLFVAWDQEIRTSIYIPRSVFVNLNTWVYLNWVNSSNEQFWIECKYKDNTHLTVQCKTNSVGKTINVYGFNKIY